MSKNLKQLTIRLPQDVHKQLKIECAKQGVSINAIIEQLVQNYLKKMK